MNLPKVGEIWRFCSTWNGYYYVTEITKPTTKSSYGSHIVTGRVLFTNNRNLGIGHPIIFGLEHPWDYQLIGQ